jgi:hypothetical protein
MNDRFVSFTRGPLVRNTIASLVTIGVGIGMAIVAGCDPIPLPAIGSSGVQAQEVGADKPANPADPFGSCLVTDVNGFLVNFDCSQGHTTCTGWGSGVTCDGGSCPPQTFHMVCDHPCYVAADCPIPATGSSRAVCHPDFHTCQLPCDASTTCPDGHTCQATAEWGLFDGAGKPIPLPFMCMQTISVTIPPQMP